MIDLFMFDCLFVCLLGWLVSSHPIDNPDNESEMYLLREYAPDVPHDTLINLTGTQSNTQNKQISLHHNNASL